MNSAQQVARTLSFFAKIIKQRKGEFSLLLIFRVITSFIPLIVPWYYGSLVQTITHAGVASHDVLSKVWYILATIAGRYLLEFVAWRIIEYVIMKFETNSMRELYMICFDYVHKHSHRFFANSFTGSLVKRINKLVNAFEALVDIFVFDLVQLVIMVVSLIVIMWHQSWVLGLMFLGRILIYGIFQYVLYKRLLPYDLASQEQDSVVTGVLSDTITNHANIATFASLSYETGLFGQTADKRKLLKQQSWYKNNVIYATNSILMLVVELAIMAFIINLRAKWFIQVGLIVALQIYLLQLFDRIFFIGKTFKRLFSAISEGAEMIEILDMPHEVQDSPNARPLQVIKGSIMFDAVNFNYNANTLFSNFNLNIAAGEKVWLVGPSGSGKSTITKLLFRLYDIQKGKIMIDGQDIAEITQESLRWQISLVPQEPLLFHRSLRDNIAYGKPNASMEEIIHASKMARCHDFVSALPEGYDTFVGERGIKLSGWERQRVAIARAILEDKKILVMDEATSSLDSESEKFIQEAIHEVIQHKTAIIIAHRLSTIKEMDRIVVMQEGKIVEQGSHVDLVDKHGGLYSRLWDIQAN